LLGQNSLDPAAPVMVYQSLMMIVGWRWKGSHLLPGEYWSAQTQSCRIITLSTANLTWTALGLRSVLNRLWCNPWSDWADWCHMA